MESFIASLTADSLRVSLLQAYVHAASPRDPMWALHGPEKPVEHFARLAEQMPAVEARLASLLQARKAA